MKPALRTLRSRDEGRRASGPIGGFHWAQDAARIDGSRESNLGAKTEGKCYALHSPEVKMFSERRGNFSSSTVERRYHGLYRRSAGRYQDSECDEVATASRAARELAASCINDEDLKARMIATAKVDAKPRRARGRYLGWRRGLLCCTPCPVDPERLLRRVGPTGRCNSWLELFSCVS